MNRCLLKIVFVVTLLPLSAVKLYAWPPGGNRPVARIANWYKFTTIGQYVGFNAIRYSYDPDDAPPHCCGEGIEFYMWDWPSQARDASPADWLWTEDGGIGSCYFDTTGIYYVTVYVEDDEGETASDYSKVHVVEVNLDGGGYLALGDMKQISLSINPSYPTLYVGQVKLQALDGGENIEVWDEQQTLVGLPATWQMSNGGPPSTLWVKGIATSSSLNDIVLELSYKYYSTPVDSETIDFTVLNIEITDITEADGSPVSHYEFAFNSNNPGVCSLMAVGTSGVSSLDTDLIWTLGDIDGSVKSPDPAIGPEIIFTYTGLPENNSEFGQKALTLTHQPSGFQDTQTVEIFFNRDAYNHAGEGSGTTRNWYYYWKEGGVVSDILGDPEDPEDDFEYEDNDNYWGFYYWPPDNRLVVCNRAPDSDQQHKTFTNQYYQTSIHTGEDGIAQLWALGDDTQELYPLGYGYTPNGEPHANAIDGGPDGLQTTQQGDDTISGNFITTGANGICETEPLGNDQFVWYGDIQMEVGHGKPFSTSITAGPNGYLDTDPVWWSDDNIDLTSAQTEEYNIEYSGIDLCALVCTHELQHKTNYLEPGSDNDGDHVKNHLENGVYHLHPNRSDTYDMAGEFPDRDYYSYGDDEFLCRMAEMNPGPGSRDSSKDWSEGGKQWQK